MLTSWDKALVAFIMAVLSILNLAFGFDLGIGETTVSAIIAAITPILVYIIPNRTSS